MCRHRTESVQGEEGFALVVALLALLVLTVLGMSLAVTTSTEVQIAANYRWSQQALYNAEAGLEAGKVFLRTIPGNWTGILPNARTGVTWTWDGTPPGRPTDPSGTPTTAADGTQLRHYENWGCDGRGGQVGYGLVLNDAGAPAPQGPFQNVTFTLGQAINGAFTLWVRRYAEPVGDGTFRDSTDNNRLVLTVEGVAPYFGAALGTARGQANASVKLLEIELSRGSSADLCESYRGQTGGSSSGSGFWNCGALGNAKDCAAAAIAIGTLGDDKRSNVTGFGSDKAGSLCDTGVR